MRRAIYLLQGCVFEIRIVLRCLIGESVLFVGPSAEINVSATLATERAIPIGCFVTARAATLGAYNDANLSLVHGLDAKGHFKRYMIGAGQQATITILTHHADPNHQAIAADLRHET